jgi:hypothetical protein
MKIIISEQQLKRIITEQSEVLVKITGEQPYPTGTNWDTVHGILGSKKIDDDLEQRVGDKLKQGNYEVTDVEFNSYIQGNKIITDATVTLTPNDDNPDFIFTTRGSIGKTNFDEKDSENYMNRYRTQDKGLKDRLSNYYKGFARQLTFRNIKIKGTDMSYAQAFYAVSKKINDPYETSSVIQQTPSKDTSVKTQPVDKPINTQQSTFNGNFEDGKTYMAIRDKDNQKYQLTVQNLDNVTGKNFNIKIVGPGTYGGQKLNGQPFELTLTSPNVLSGNNEMGDFTIVSNNGKPVGNNSTTPAAKPNTSTIITTNCANQLINISNVKNKLLKFGCKTQGVKELQTILSVFGKDGAPTGYFGKRTKQAVIDFQKTHKDSEGKDLVPDGKVGTKTYEALTV